MMTQGSRLRQIGWAVALTICVTLFLALTFRVNAIKSDVRLAEREIVALEREKTMLEIEFQTRASQSQLANYNRVEFGYRPPSADQYLESERQMASLGLPRGANAPDPIRVARGPDGNPADGFADGVTGGFPAMVSPLTGRAVDDDRRSGANDESDRGAPRSLAERLAMENPLGNAGSGARSGARSPVRPNARSGGGDFGE